MPILSRASDPDGSGPQPVQMTRYAYDGSNVWADFDAAGNVTARYLFGDGANEILARFRPGEGTSWYLTDRVGTVRDIANAQGAVVDHLDYDSYGNVVLETDPSLGDRFRFAGQQFDSANGLCYDNARYYDPQLGRFISQDPLSFSAGDVNLYRYVANAPTNYVDPTGTEFETDPILTRTALAVAEAEQGYAIGFACGFLDAWAGGAPDPFASALDAGAYGAAIGAGLGYLSAGQPAAAASIGVLFGAIALATAQNEAQLVVRVGCTIVAFGSTKSGRNAIRNFLANESGSIGPLPQPNEPVLFGQKRVSPTFSEDAPPHLAGRDIIDVAGDLRSGRLSADQIPIKAFRDPSGQVVSANSRSLSALSEAGMKPTNIKMVAATNKLASSAEFVGEFPLRKGTECVI